MELKSLYAIAKELNTSVQNLSQMIKRNPETAPKPLKGGKYDFDEVKEFYELHTYSVGTGAKELKEAILLQEYRLKKLKADEAEGLVIPADWVVDAIRDADICLESVMTEFAHRYTRDDPKGKEAYKGMIEVAKVHFKRWRDFIENINDPVKRKKFVNSK